jgi:menaquinone-dependent protoporphyrinogen IX oxidase
MKAVIIYNSKTGFTKRYASWIQEETGFEMIEDKNISKEILESYDLVIYGGRIHAGQINRYKQFIKKLSDKSKLIVFATGATPANAKETIKTMWDNNFTKEEQETIPHYYFQSGLNYDKMQWGDKLIMKALAKMLSKKNTKSPEESGCEQSISQSYDISSKEFIKPLIECIREK